jgi:hypothetical protein
MRPLYELATIAVIVCCVSLSQVSLAHAYEPGDRICQGSDEVTPVHGYAWCMVWPDGQEKPFIYGFIEDVPLDVDYSRLRFGVYEPRDGEQCNGHVECSGGVGNWWNFKLPTGDYEKNIDHTPEFVDIFCYCEEGDRPPSNF